MDDVDEGLLRAISASLGGSLHEASTEPLRRCSGQGHHLAMAREPCGFSRVAVGFWSYAGALSGLGVPATPLEGQDHVPALVAVEYGVSGRDVDVEELGWAARLFHADEIR